jgi:hypothetical protein
LFVQLQWTMNAETERLRALPELAIVDEAQVVDQIDRALGTRPASLGTIGAAGVLADYCWVAPSSTRIGRSSRASFS